MPTRASSRCAREMHSALPWGVFEEACGDRHAGGPDRPAERAGPTALRSGRARSLKERGSHKRPLPDKIESGLPDPR
ncbi:hypothetical protein SGLAM104S_01978 [Streptomyces glaucescens]